MPHTHNSPSKSRRDLAASLRGSRPRKHARLRHRRLQAERLEDRRLLTADFELSSILPANGGDGSSGFVMNGITDKLQLGRSANASPQPLGDVNGDNNDDFYLPALGSTGATAFTLFQAYIIYGQGETQGGFPAELDLTTLDGTNGYVIDSVDLYRTYQTGMWGGVVGDINGDGFSDISIDQARPAASGGWRSFMLFGGSENLSALDQADGTTDGHIKLSTIDTATDGTRGFVIDTYVLSAGDVNGDHVDDLVTTKTTDEFQGVYVIYGRDSNQGHSFPAAYELSSLLPVHGGNGSEGFVIPVSSSGYALSVRSAGDVNDDGIGDIILADPLASPLGRTNAGQAWVIFGQGTNFPVTFNLASLNGSNGFTVYGKTGEALGLGGAGSAGDVNGDNADDRVISSSMSTVMTERNAYVLFGKDTSTAGPFSAVLETSALNGSNGFVMAGYDALANVLPVGDVNGDGNDDIAIGVSGQNYIVFGRPSFGARLELPSLLAANGGDGSAGYSLSGFPELFGACQGIGDINHDGFADVRIGSYLFDSNGLTDNGRVYVVYGKPSTPVTTKFYVVNDATQNLTYEYNAAATFANGSSHAADVSFALAAGNTNPQGIADPPAPGSLRVAETSVLAEPVSAEASLRGNDAALENMYYEPLKKVRVDTARRSESRTVESHTRDLSYTVGASANRVANDSVANDKHHSEVDDLFAQWDSDPLALFSVPDLGL